MPFQIIRQDLTKVRADVIVNSANPEPIVGAGTDSAVYAAAGAEKLLAARKKIGRIAQGDAAATPAFSLPARYILHTVGPVWTGGENGEEEVLRSCYRTCLQKAEELGAESIAFPLISSGTYGYPRDRALTAAVSVFSEWLTGHDTDITLAVFDGESFRMSGKIFREVDAYIDETYARERAEKEYGFYMANMAPSVCWEEEELSADEPAAPAGDEDAMCAPSSPWEESAHYMQDASFSPRPPRPSAQKKPAPAAREEGGGRKGKTLAQILADARKKEQGPVIAPGDTFQEKLLKLIDERGLTDTEVYKKANLDRKLFSKIRCNAAYKPKKRTALALAVALELSLPETEDLLSRAEMAFSPSSVSDIIITWFLRNENYDIGTINMALFDHHQPQLGGPGE